MNALNPLLSENDALRIPMAGMCRSISLFVGSLFGAGMLSAGPTDHLDRGLELVDHILEYQLVGEFQNDQNEDINNYGGSWNQGTVILEVGDPDADVMPFNRAMCGSFVTKLLNQSYNWDWSDYPFHDDVNGDDVMTESPTAHYYMELILEGEGFKFQVDSIADILPGDIMVKRNLNPIEGHVWIVKEVHIGNPMAYPINHNNGWNHLEGMTYYEVDVLDCSNGYHSNDSRKVLVNNVVHNTHGAGTGTIGIMVDGNGTITGHSWSLPHSDYNQSLGGWVNGVNGVNSRIELLADTEFVVARLDIDDDGDGGFEPLDLARKAPELPLHLDYGTALFEQIEAMAILGITADANGRPLNQYGGRWKSAKDPAMIRFGDLDRGLLPANNTKGASLVTLLLGEAYGWSWWDYPFVDTLRGTSARTSSPTSSRYVDLIEQGVGFEAQVTDLSHVLPGDVIAIRDWATGSGHTAMVEGIDWTKAVPYPSGTSVELEGAWVVPVKVLDSTRFPHSNDTRRDEIGSDEGIGIGTMAIVMNRRYEIIGHLWSLPSADQGDEMDRWLAQFHSRLKMQTERQLVVGRLP